jgi:hypothetical protein
MNENRWLAARTVEHRAALRDYAWRASGSGAKAARCAARLAFGPVLLRT